MERKNVTVSTISNMKANGESIVMITAYDVAMARNVDEAGVDMILVGDSLGNVVMGYQSTLPVTVEDMIHHTQCVMRANPKAMVIADMPFMSYQASIEDGIRNAGRIMKETGCAGVKLEGGVSVAPLVKRLVEAGIPVVAHIGLTPQSVNAFGGFKVQGKTVEAAQQMIEDAKTLEEAGAFACVLECVPAALAKKVTENCKVMATIGIGAGSDCDGQVLVCNDLLGVSNGFTPKFVKKYANLHDITVNAVKEYINDCKARTFPAAEHTFKLDDSVLEKLY